jgi:hypothetical protein
MTLARLSSAATHAFALKTPTSGKRLRLGQTTLEDGVVI